MIMSVVGGLQKRVQPDMLFLHVNIQMSQPLRVITM